MRVSRGGPQVRIDEDIKAQVLAALVLGEISVREISRKFKVSRPTITRWHKQWRFAQEHTIQPDSFPMASQPPPPQPQPQPPRPPIESLHERNVRTQREQRHVDAVRSAEALSALVYDACYATVDAIRVRAIETARPEWILKQTGDALARLDEVQWAQVARLVTSFRPVDPRGGAAAAGPTPALTAGTARGDESADQSGDDGEDEGDDLAEPGIATAAADLRGHGAVDSAS